MSDHDAAPDPTDRAYAQAEAVLDDAAARAARRARVLGAVAGETTQAPAVSSPPAPRAGLRWGGWLVAASVAGLSALLAVQVYLPASVEQQAPETKAALPAIATSPAPVEAAPPPPAAPAAAAARPPAVERRAETPTPREPEAPPPPSAFPAAEARVSPPAAAPAQAPTAGAEEIVVTGSARSAPPPMTTRSAVEGAARLRDAAAAGRTAEVAALLAEGVPVDAPDDEGETALMKSIKAGRPAAAALLRRHGASLDRENRAGRSAREMAAEAGDAELDRALGLRR